MTLISIREYGISSAGYPVVSFDNEEYPITVQDPLTPENREKLDYYFRDYPSLRYANPAESVLIARIIQKCGEDLFEQVFSNREVYYRYKDSRDRLGFHQLKIEIAGGVSFQRLKWETLRDPELKQLIALKVPIVRTSLKPQLFPSKVRESPMVNLLVVPTRPIGLGDVGYRTVSRTIVETLRQTSVQVNVEAFVPGTYKALAKHLEDMIDGHGLGHFHIIHFDAPVASLNYAQLEQGFSNQLFQDHRYRFGRGSIEAYSDTKLFVFMEGDKEWKPDPVEAGELAELLMNSRIPIVIFSSLHSNASYQSNNQFVSPTVRTEGVTQLATQLIEAGVQAVLTFDADITLDAAKIMAQTLYRELLAGKDLARAVSRMRWELYNDKLRRGHYTTLEMEDWILPIVYENQPQQLAIRNFTKEENENYYRRVSNYYREPNLQYGFLGREPDIITIQRLLTQHNILLVYGIVGVGKTVLLQYLASWWQITRFVEEVFYFSFKEKFWTCQEILKEIGKKLQLDLPDDMTMLRSFIAQKLRPNCHLLILDDLESTSGTHLSTEKNYPQDEWTDLRQFLVELTRGKTLVLCSSRYKREWLVTGAFGDHVYKLPGLDTETASILAASLLTNANLSKYQEDPDFQTLITVLDGHPLAMKAIVSLLSRETPSQTLRNLQFENQGENHADKILKLGRLFQCIGLFFSDLTPEIQRLIACLAPFSSTLNTLLLPPQTKEMLTLASNTPMSAFLQKLRRQDELAHLPFERWSDIFHELENSALILKHPTIPGLYYLDLTLRYFLGNYFCSPDREKVQHAVETAYCEYYDHIASIIAQPLHSTSSADKLFGQLVVSLEHDNLVGAFKLALSRRRSVLNYWIALATHYEAVNDSQHKSSLSKLVLHHLEENPISELPRLLLIEFSTILKQINRWQQPDQQYVVPFGLPAPQQLSTTSIETMLEEQDRNINESLTQQTKSISQHILQVYGHS